jgi:hypothetical protein
MSRLSHILDNRLTDGDEAVSLMRRLPFMHRKIPGTHFLYRLSWPQGHSAAGRITSIEKSNDFIRNRTRNLPACSIAPQPTTASSLNYLKYPHKHKSRSSNVRWMGWSETTNYNALAKNSVHTLGTIFGSVTFESPTQHHGLTGTHVKHHTGMTVSNVLITQIFSKLECRIQKHLLWHICWKKKKY